MVKLQGLQVTERGRPFKDQGYGLRLFKDASSTKERYRIHKGPIGWVAYHNGNRIVDTYEMRNGAENPGILIDQIIRIRRFVVGNRFNPPRI